MSEAAGCFKLCLDSTLCSPALHGNIPPPGGRTRLAIGGPTSAHEAGLALLLGIDTGGTYTDAVLYDDEHGVVAAAKSLTTKHDLALGVRAAVDAVLPSPVPDIRLVSLSTTLATNAIVEGQGNPVCLILVGQREDALERAGLRQALGGDPVVLVSGGHGAHGEERSPLDLEVVRSAVLTHAPRVSAFAVAGYFAVRNAAHERAIRDLVRELTGLPVTCSHELTSNLDAPRRALTAVLNARLIPLLQELILVVEELLEARKIQAPLMVVMGDGSLISAETALMRPVETILSGPAASVVGARYLSQEDDAYVVDIGGTTTDIALLREGRPALNLKGATVAGWHTMVEAIDVHTVGLGGDSELRLDEAQGLVVGPRRAMPLSLLAHLYPASVAVLGEQLERGSSRPHDGRFAMRLRHLSDDPGSLTTGERRLWDALAGGPTSVERLMAEHPLERQLARLVHRGLVIVAAFTPSDAAHVLGIHNAWCAEAAAIGARLWARRDIIASWEAGDDAAGFARLVIEQLVAQSAEALLAAALDDQHGITLDSSQSIARLMIRHALAATAPPDPLWELSIRLRRAVVAIGAPASTYYPQVAERLHARLCVPPHADVCNAVGAVASGVMRVAKALITSPEPGRYRVHVPSGVRDFDELELAAGFARDETSRSAEALALESGAATAEVAVRRDDRTAALDGGEALFLESEVTATAVGRPRTGT